MKAAQKRKLLTKNKDGEFINNDNYQILRHRSIIDERVIEESEQVYKETGVIWVVDQKATLEWLEAKNGVIKSREPLVFDGLEITEENVDQFAKDNGINFGRTKDVNKKLEKVTEFINNQ